MKRVVLVIDDPYLDCDGAIKDMEIGKRIEVEHDHDTYVYFKGTLIAVSVVDLDTNDIEVLKTT